MSLLPALIGRGAHRLLYWGVAFLVAYVLFTCYAAYKLYTASSASSSSEEEGILVQAGDVLQRRRNATAEHVRLDVEVWGKAAVGLYLWEHVLGATLQDVDGGLWRYGVFQVGDLTLTYRNGPAITLDTVPPHATHVILVLNGRSPEKIEYSRTWLDHLKRKQHSGRLKKAAVVILGDEKCENDWLLPYMASRGGPINAVFMIYDSLLIDNKEFFQWPLGVAIYRNFPRVDAESLDIVSQRAYTCNFFGTVYPGSSREELMDILERHNLRETCYSRTRSEWVPQETEETLSAYVDALRQSDLTLSPTGKNTECYRFLEALSLGSIPVVEDVSTPGKCSTEPLRLLKKHKAPFIYIKHWNEIVGLLEKEKQLSLQDKVSRRRHALEWYQDFRKQMKKLFLGVIMDKFFSHASNVLLV